MRAYHANGFFSHTHAMTTHAMFAPYKSRVVSRGGLLLPLTYLPGTSVEFFFSRTACTIVHAVQSIDYAEPSVAQRKHRVGGDIASLAWINVAKRK